MLSGSNLSIGHDKKSLLSKERAASFKIPLNPISSILFGIISVTTVFIKDCIEAREQRATRECETLLGL
jgi:hypothetical protein